MNQFLRRGFMLFVVISLLFVQSPFTSASASPSSGLGSMVAQIRGDADSPFVPFDVLSGYDCVIAAPGHTQAPKIPENVKQLNGKKLSVVGFMVPMQDTSHGVTVFMLLRNQMSCCFGVPPRLNDLILVETSNGRPVPFTPDIPVLVSGRFQVGVQYQQQDILCLYKMQADTVRIP